MHLRVVPTALGHACVRADTRVYSVNGYLVAPKALLVITTAVHYAQVTRV